MIDTNQDSEDERIIKDNDRIYQGLAHLHRQKHLKEECFCTSEISGVYRVVIDEINVIIRTEKLKLLTELNEVTSHSDDTDDYEWYMKNKLSRLEAEL